MENVEGDVGRIVSQFLLGTCQRRYPLRHHKDMRALTNCAGIVNSPFSGCFCTPLITGSIAELYIDPLLPCFGDTDIMYHLSNEVAIPASTPPPTQLPAEFGNAVQVYEITDTKFPGYVYLFSRYLLAKLSEDGKYRATECEHFIRPHRWGNVDSSRIHGPAYDCQSQTPDILQTLFGQSFTKQDASMHTDFVACVRCLSWPLQAADWPTRHRNYGWPDSTTVDRVVSNGCDVVPVAYKFCRDDDREASHQWRVSFSRAEIVLINSWVRVQQIVYHMLRIYFKTGLNLETRDSTGLLSNYHIKTLMLWACELKPRSWWTDDLNVVEVCVELLHVLGVWLRDARCKHYFINKCNLLSDIDGSCLQPIHAKLTSVTVESLSKWFVSNYIGRVWKSKDFNGEVSSWSDEVISLAMLEDVVTQCVMATRDSPFRDLYNFAAARCNIIQCICVVDSLTVRHCSYLMPELAKLDRRFPVYFVVMVFLHIAHRTAKHSLTDELLNVLATVGRLATTMPTTNRAQESVYESVKQLVTKVLGRISVYREKNVKCDPKCRIQAQQTAIVITNQLCKSELVELLQQNAGDLLKTFLLLENLEPRVEPLDLHSVLMDLEPICAYRRGDYERCLQTSADNLSISKMIPGSLMIPCVFAYPEIVQLMSDDIASLTALTVLVNPDCRKVMLHLTISQLTSSLYLQAQCQMKLNHSLKSLAETLDHVQKARRDGKQMLNGCWSTLDHLLLKLTERQISMYMGLIVIRVLEAWLHMPR